MSAQSFLKRMLTENRLVNILLEHVIPVRRKLEAGPSANVLLLSAFAVVLAASSVGVLPPSILFCCLVSLALAVLSTSH